MKLYIRLLFFAVTCFSPLIQGMKSKQLSKNLVKKVSKHSNIKKQIKNNPLLNIKHIKRTKSQNSYPLRFYSTGIPKFKSGKLSVPEAKEYIHTPLFYDFEDGFVENFAPEIQEYKDEKKSAGEQSPKLISNEEHRQKTITLEMQLRNISNKDQNNLLDLIQKNEAKKALELVRMDEKIERVDEKKSVKNKLVLDGLYKHYNDILINLEKYLNKLRRELRDSYSSEQRELYTKMNRETLLSQKNQERPEKFLRELAAINKTEDRIEKLRIRHRKIALDEEQSAKTQQRIKIAQEFLPVIEALGRGDTNITSKHIKFSEKKPNKEYKISYYIDGKEVGYQQYTIVDNKSYNTRVGYLATLHVYQEFRGYGLGKFLMKAAIAHLKSKDTHIVWLRRGKGEYALKPTALDQLFRSEGFSPWDKDGEIYELTLRAPNISTEELIEAKPIFYENTGLEDSPFTSIYE